MRRQRTVLRIVGFAVALAVAIACTTATAQAQSPYIGASALADISRFGTAGGGNGETFGAAVRAGTTIGDRWGVDVEFTRTGTLEQEMSFDTFPFLPAGPIALSSSLAFIGGGSAPAIGRLIPDVRLRTTTTQQYATLTAMPWVLQNVGARAQIVYLGGIAFVRSERTARVGFGVPIRFDGRGDGQALIRYAAGPAVGLDVRVSMTDHLRFVPGMRLLVVDEGGRSGWLTRPSLGVQWSF